MKKRAIIFPGQGSQFVGMGKDFYDHYLIAREVFEEVDDTLGKKLSKIIFEGPDNDLTLTQNAQPALMATSIAILRVIMNQTNKSIEDLCHLTLGHSLGEFTAMCAAGILSLSDTTSILELRGKSMQSAVKPGDGSMMAVLGLDIEQTEKLTQKFSQNAICQIANDNCPGQQVVSGNSEAIKDFARYLATNNIKHVILNVSAPFHCSLIKSAEKIMAEKLTNTQMYEPAVPLISNVDAKSTTDVNLIRNNAVLQVTGRVRWRESIEFAKSQAQIEHIIEIGPKKVLCGLTRKIDRSININAVGCLSDMEDILKIL